MYAKAADRCTIQIILLVDGEAMPENTPKTRKEARRPFAFARSFSCNPKALIVAGAIVILFLSLLCNTCHKPAQKSDVASSNGESYGEAASSTPTAANGSSATDTEREQFIANWAERIDAYNAGFPLEGYGATFAAAAYDHGVDPRYSPAIARVESGSGSNCFRFCNAWGWGSSSWPDWDTAIYAHVQGLAEGYGYTLSYKAALKYNSSNPDEWYGLVRNCMDQIWPSDS